jgi:hypothetical protein
LCTITGADQAERVRRWRELLAQARCRQTIDRGLRFELPTALVAEVAELAAAEQQCCAFFDFTLRLAGGGLQLEVRAPEDAAPLLAELFGTHG